MAKIIMWSLLILPWLSLLFMNKMALRRYMPAALFATVMNTIVYQLAWTFDWWKYEITLFSWDRVAQAHTVYSAFLVGTLWIFHLTYGRFWLYLLVNFGVDLIYAFGLRSLWRSLKITTGGNLSPLEGLAIMTVMAILLYLYQMWQEKIFSPQTNEEHPDGEVRVTWISRSLKSRT